MDALTKEKLEFVNVALYKDGSDKIVQGMTSDMEGSFDFQNVEKGSYQLKISFVGYKQMTIPVALTANKPNAALGNIFLHEDTKVLSEVQVTGQKSQMKFEVDKRTFNVDQNIASAGASASEALSNIPSISVDNEGNVSLRNNSSVTIWINGRPSGITEDNQAQILEQLPAESIESIEVITNPSARYSSEGSAGIINIVMKKEKNKGYYGGVSAGGNTLGGYSASANININYKKFEGLASAGYRYHSFDTNGETVRTSYLGDGSESILNQNSDGKGSGGGIFARLGGTYNITRKDALGLSLSMMDGNRNRDNRIVYNYPFSSKQSSERITKGRTDHKMISGSIDYTHTFAKDHDLRLSGSYDHNNNSGDTRYTQIDGDNIYYQLQDAPRERSSYEAQADYQNKFAETFKVEAGYKGKWSSRDQKTQTWDALDKLPESEQNSLYNDFVYDETIQAAYVTLSGMHDKLSYQAGLRGEYTDYSTETTGYNSNNTLETTRNNKNYFDLFPSAFISYSLPHGNEMQLNYTRRIQRPRGRQLNPFKNISDSANISYGNPNLSPEYTHSMELNYIKNWEEQMLSASLFYRATDGVIQQVSYLDGTSLISTSDNVTNSVRSGIELVGKNKLFKILDFTTTVNLYYYKMDGFTYKYNETSFEYKGSETFAWDARMIANIMLPWRLSFQVTGNYTAPTKNAQGKSYESYWLDAGLRRSFLNRKLTVAVTGRDLLDSRRFKNYTFGENFSQISKGQWGGRQLGINISYSFGNMSLSKTKKRQNGMEESGNVGDMSED